MAHRWPSSLPKYTVPSATTGEESTGPSVVTRHLMAPVVAFSAHSRWSWQPTYRVLPEIAGVVRMLPRESSIVCQRNAPVAASSACTYGPSPSPTYRVPSCSSGVAGERPMMRCFQRTLPVAGSKAQMVPSLPAAYRTPSASAGADSVPQSLLWYFALQRRRPVAASTVRRYRLPLT
ncbi:hypothetical protein M2271_004515 [Streptomyces sp. LBL]|uniref:hypothetical protein n=1 Tax=Streptomyces sp. LBL TaxID=2940562 RepID=UPI0024765B81|nr:hypothetical protein [Streptomyces sp. LBL]MDH6626698.1 hypothetical protein [Streptomyces sp. LBL]